MQVDNMRKVSVACTSLCMWVHAIERYSRVYRDVVPKQKRLEEMNAALSVANAVLAEKQSELRKVVEAADAKQRVCDATAGEKSRLENEADTTRARLVRAEKLTKGLASEGLRWRDEVAVVTAKVLRPRRGCVSVCVRVHACCADTPHSFLLIPCIAARYARGRHLPVVRLRDVLRSAHRTLPCRAAELVDVDAAAAGCALHH
jgi:hypothetical protein